MIKKENKNFKKSGDFVAILHNIRSLHNVGSIFRTADGAGFGKIHPHTKRASARKSRPENNARYGVGVYLCGITPAPVDRFGKPVAQLVKTSLGAEKSVEWQKTASTTLTIKKLKADGYTIIAVEQSKKSIPYYKIRGIRMDSRIRIALVVGNEVRGLPDSVLKLADKILEIPMLGKKESLNVSVAFGIVAYHISTARLTKI